MNLILLTPEDFLDKETVRLEGRRLEHVRSVHRAAVGDRLTVGVVDGMIGEGEVLALDQAELRLKVTLNQVPPSPLDITLIMALARPKMLKRVLINVVSSGVKEIHLINSYRVEKSFWKSPVLMEGSLRELITLGLEQGKDTGWPAIYQHTLFKPFVEDRLPGILAGKAAFIAHPYHAQPCPADVSGPIALVVGPEGGFIPYEVEMLCAAGCRPVHMGERILRVDAAVSALLGRLMRITTGVSL